MIDSVISTILNPIRNGQNIYCINGDMSDFRVSIDNKIKKIETLFAEQLLSEFGAVLFQFSLATGLHFSTSGLSPKEISCINHFLERFNLNQFQSSGRPHEDFVSLVRRLFEIIKIEERPHFENGKPMQLAFLFKYIDHLIPNMQPGYQDQFQLTAMELMDMLNLSLDLRNSSSYIILNGKTGNMDQQLKNNLTSVDISYPGESEKKEFLSITSGLYRNAKLENGLEMDQIVHLTMNTPNRSLENTFRGSHYSGQAVSLEAISEKREKDIIKLSEGTLSALNTDRLANELYGRNIRKPVELLMKVVKGLKDRDTRTPSNVLLVGPKSTGKSDLAVMTAHASNLPCFRANSPRSQWVGETERLARKMFDLLSYTFTPCIGIIDELELQFPMDRNKTAYDSGASASVTGILQEVLSDRSRNGKSLLIGTSNKPIMGASMFERFDLVIPVLMPLKEDFPQIINALAKTIEQNWSAPIDDSRIMEAAELFYDKHASPRSTLAAFKRAVTYHDGLFNEDIVLWCARNMRAQADYLTAVYCDLLAIKLSGNELLPWFEQADYPFPDHIKEVMTGNEIDEEKLNYKLKQLEEHARV